MTAPASRWLTGGRTRLVGTSLGSPAGGELPNSAMYWNGLTPGWPSGDLANYNQWKALCGRAPDVVRLYTSAADTTSGVTGSAGNYGLFTPDWRSIANDGAILAITFTDVAASGWATVASDLNAAGSNATKTRYLNIIQNLKRWHDDTGNTAPIKSIMFGTRHEPSKDAGAVGSNYVAMTQAVVNFFLDNGIGYGPKPATGHGSSYAGTWYDMIEWFHVGIGYDMRHAAGEYAYYPGDGFVQWVLADIYAWSGGYPDSPGTGFTHTKAGQIAQPGDTGPFSHYTDSLKTLRTIAANPLSWYTAGAGGSRPVNFGLGEFAISEDLDQFNTSGNNITAGKTHSADKYIKGDWYKAAIKWFRAEAFTVAGGHNAGNNIPADVQGLLMTCVIHWNSQAAQPRWFNTIPFNTNDTTGPTVGGADAHYSYDAFVAMVNDTIFSTTPVIHTPPVGDFVDAATEGGGDGDVTFDATITSHDGAIVSYTWDPGDGTSPVVHSSALLTDEFLHTYGAGGVYNATLTVLDANALTLVVTHQVVIVPAFSPLSHAPYINPLDRVKALRSTYNPAVDALEGYTQSRVVHIGMKSGTWTNQPSAVTQFLGGNTARHYVDLKGMTKVKAVCFLSTAGTTGAKLAPAYSIDGGTTWKFFDTAGASGTTVAGSLLGPQVASDTATFHTSSWGDIPTEARIEGLLVTMYGAGGNATDDPVFESVGLRVK